jgi:hypothetical protein
MVIFAQQKTTVSTKLITSSFMTNYFTKNVDSLCKARSLMDSFIRINKTLNDKATEDINKLDVLIDQYRLNIKNGDLSSIISLVLRIRKSIKERNSICDDANSHIAFFNDLLPRITARLQKFAEDNSTATKTILIDWRVYLKVHQEFIDWHNNMIRELNSSISGLNTKQSKIVDKLEATKND